MAGYPNLEVVARDWLRTDLNTDVPAAQRIRVENESPGNQKYTARLVVVFEPPGSPGDAQLTLDVTDLQVDCLAGDRVQAKALGDLARTGLRLRFRRWTHPSGLFINDVRTLAKPVIVPSGSTRLYLSTATYRVWAHAPGLS